jgi:hypothetical protein
MDKRHLCEPSMSNDVPHSSLVNPSDATGQVHEIITVATG